MILEINKFLSINDAKRIDLDLNQLPWAGSSIDWDKIKGEKLRISLFGEITTASIHYDTFKRFKACQGKNVVIYYSPSHQPWILDTDDFIYNWLSIFEELLEFPKFIVFCYEKIWQPGYLENSIECEPMGELIGLI